MTENPHFRIVEEGNAVEIGEGTGNGFHLGPIIRKYTAARLQVKSGRQFTTVEFSRLWDAIGLLRSLQYDIQSFNSLASHKTNTQSESRYHSFRLSRQASAFGVRLPRVGESHVSAPGLDDLVALVESKNVHTMETAKAMIASGISDFESLSELFKPGEYLLDRGAATGLYGIPTAFLVRACYFTRGKSLFGVISTFYAAMECIVAIGGRFAVIECHIPIKEFQGTKSTRDGFDNFVVLSETVRLELRARGALYEKLSSSSFMLLEYAEGCFQSSIQMAANGTKKPVTRGNSGTRRIMIDMKRALFRGEHCARSEGLASEAVRGAMKLISQREKMSVMAAIAAADAVSTVAVADINEEEQSLELLMLQELPDKLLCITWPLVAGFSFATKSWGTAIVSSLKLATFNDEAFDRLVLPKRRKDLIKALVSGYGISANNAKMDVIAGKGEGTIFLLHGPPGCGKTLTAEAVAELLHTPLYTISMGELGTTPEALEQRLLEVLDLCSPWGALVLIDEAEMLLETRNSSDVLRNAMVCVMLRLLEYYKGVLFLTTNRVSSLDPAFQSRVQCALRYDALDRAGRAAIWTDLLERADSLNHNNEVIDVDTLSKYELNGRQIKNVVQLALTLSKHEGVGLKQRHIDETLEMTTEFLKDIS